MDSYIVRGTAFNGQIRVLAARTTGLAEEIRQRHDLWPTAAAALGRAVTAGAMMGMMLKGQEKLTIDIRGDGALRKIIVDATATGEVRGYVGNPHVHYPLNQAGKLDVSKAVGSEGQLAVVKDLGMKEPYRGSVPLVSGELGEDFAYYFTVSEQTPSAVGVGVLINADHSVKAAGGFILQLLPEVDEMVISMLEERLSKTASVSTLIDRGLSPEELLSEILGEHVRILDNKKVVFSCHCSKERVKGALAILGKEEVQSILEENGEAEVTCHFCNEKYVVNREELQELLANLNK